MAEAQARLAAGFNTLLVATDFSARSETALSCAAAIARKTDARVIVAHAINPERWHLVAPEEMHPALCNERRTTEKKMASTLKSDKLRNVRTEAVIQEGDFRQVLCNVAHQRHVDLLVASTHGRKGFSKLLFGSKIEEVCNRTPCPILLVGPKVKILPGAKFVKILFATDLTALSLGSLPSVLAFASQHGSRLKVVRVVPEDEGSTRGSGREFALAQLKTEICATITTRAGLAYEPEFEVEAGPAKETILQTARKWGADLIGLGAHRPGALAVYLPGDLAYEVACDASCPILTIID